MTLVVTVRFVILKGWVQPGEILIGLLREELEPSQGICHDPHLPDEPYEQGSRLEWSLQPEIRDKTNIKLRSGSIDGLRPSSLQNWT